jgi:hypothetical protein
MLIKSIDVPISVRKKTTVISAQFYEKLEIYDNKLVGINKGLEVASWFFKEYTNILIEKANLNSQFARIVFVTSASGNKKDVMISFETNSNIVGDINKIVFCSGMFSYKEANSFSEKVFNDLYAAFSSFKESGETSNKSELSPADEIKKFSDLLKEGVITQEEFDSKKKKLLGL